VSTSAQEGRENRIIVRYRQGTLSYLIPDLPTELPRLVQHLRQQGRIDDLVKWDGQGVALGSTWPHLLLEIVRNASRLPSEGPERLAAILAVLEEMCSDAPPADVWLRVRDRILENVDILSGWAHYPLRGIRERSPVIREDGRYFTVIDGERCEIIGARTEREERWDYNGDDCTRSYGAIWSLIRLPALLNICREISSRPQQFPQSILVALPENGGASFLLWNWHVRWPYRPRLTRWRPENNLCDPDWLTQDLLIAFSALEGIPDRDLEPAEWKGPHAEWEKEFEHFPRQLEFALDTYLRFGTVEEVWFRFRGVTLRWINQTENLHTILIVPQIHGNNFEREYELAMRFLSYLAFETNSRISVITSIGVARRFAPGLRQPKRAGVTLYPDNYAREERQPSGRKDLALAFYREGLSGGSVYYSFLSFYKVIQLAFNEDANRISEWIKGNLFEIREPQVKEWAATVERESGDIVGYLFKSGRCAIAHTKNEPVVDPDDPADRMRLSKDLHIVEGLARRAIETGLFNDQEATGGC
jgi:hypothetical protein